MFGGKSMILSSCSFIVINAIRIQESYKPTKSEKGRKAKCLPCNALDWRRMFFLEKCQFSLRMEVLEAISYVNSWTTTCNHMFLFVCFLLGSAKPAGSCGIHGWRQTLPLWLLEAGFSIINMLLLVPFIGFLASVLINPPLICLPVSALALTMNYFFHGITYMSMNKSTRNYSLHDLHDHGYMHLKLIFSIHHSYD